MNNIEKDKPGPERKTQHLSHAVSILKSLVLCVQLGVSLETKKLEMGRALGRKGGQYSIGKMRVEKEYWGQKCSNSKRGEGWGR